MIKFNKCNLSSKLLDQWVKTESNVLLIGEKGVGKSHKIIDTFKRNNLKYAYFSGATLDPWIHLLGIPKARIGDDGVEKMEFILPENLDNNVQAIFCDEWNRTNKIVRNALLELQQFKSINGRKFPNLKMVWGAINPPKSEDDDSSEYDVDELDPAQLDRFHIIVELPNEPDLQYFKNKFGDYRGKILTDWWKEQPKDALKILSPRRLDYVGESFQKGLDIKYLLPVSANVKELVKKLSLDEKEEIVNSILENPTNENMKEFLSDDTNFMKYKNKLKNSRLWNFWKFAKKEFIIEEIKTNENFENFAIYQVLLKEPVYRDIAVEISKSNPTNNFIKIVKSLVEQNFVPDNNNLKDFISNEPKFPILKKDNLTTNSDYFSKMHIWGYNVLPTHYAPSNSVYNLPTSERRKGMNYLADCIYSVENKYHIINFMISNLISMQKGTISNEKRFITLLGTACVFAKQILTPNRIKEMITDIQHNSRKLSSNRITEYTEYLNGAIQPLEIVPESFLKKIKDIRSLLNISGSNSDILDLLKL